MNKKLYVQLVKELFADTDLRSTINYDELTSLPGGVVSLVLATTTKTPVKPGQPCAIVVKHTFEQKEGNPLADNFGYRDWFSLLSPSVRTHHLDYEVLSLLQDAADFKVPILLRYYREKRVTVMVDFRAEGYELMQDRIVKGDLSKSSAVETGSSLASLMQSFEQINSLVSPAENRILQARERFDELHMFLRSQLPFYREIEQKFLSGRYLIPTDTHPKNIAVNSRGEVVLFDFGRSIVADSQYPAPNFAAHIALATISGCFDDPKLGIEYIEDFLKAYNEAMPVEGRVNEKWFVRYFTAELLHRGLSGRWLDSRLFKNHSLQEVERAVHDIGIEVFRPKTDRPVTSITKLMSIVLNASKAVREKRYTSQCSFRSF